MDIIWAMFFSSVVSMQYHPGSRADRMSLDHCADIADEMLKIYYERQSRKE